MGLVIKFLGQPYPGREITIDDTKDEVHFGRGIDCDVGFPEDMAIVSRSHFALKRELAGYKFVINREKPVFMNGRPVYDDQDLPKSAEIQLSGPTGPKLRVERTEGGPSNQVKTEILKPQKDLVEVVRDTKATGNRTLGLVGGIALLVAVLAGGGYFLINQLQAQITTIATQIPTLQKAVAGGPPPTTVASIIEKNKESVYLVAIQFPSGTREAMGTASVVALPDGTKALATNSHVADIFNNDLKDPKLQGATLVVTQPKGPDYATLKVVSVRKHPGYDEFGKWQEQYFGISQSLSAARMEFVPGYDVALLFVEDQTKLGQPLTYASRDEMKALKAGEQLVLIGYPSEQLNGTDAQRPEPTSQTGLITSVTTYYLSRGSDDDDVLIQHSAPATGGASGSPMFNAKGEVVAFLNAGNIILYKNQDGDTTRQPSAALVNYAQRADLLLDLAEGKADANMPHYRELMAKATQELTKTPDQFLADLKLMFGAEMGGQDNVSQLSDNEVAMDKEVPWLNGRKGAGVEVEIKDPGIYLFAAVSLDKRIIQTSVYEMLEDGTISRLNEGYDLSPYSFTATGREGKSKLFVVVADMSTVEGQDTRPPGKAKLQVFRGVQGGGS
ncbi:MAG: trypsin-like peptidase domain-containing protein [Alphaproteobacteria bacterium]|nr:trypsin-like peptidase domain-containing protein [Alphaproteobacteria bacterium]